jgi:putative phage-type endonuclease
MNSREEWLKARTVGLGGSDIGAILGLSPYRTPVDVWMDKSGRAAPQAETLQMRFGTYAEEFVAKEYSQQTGFGVQRFTTMLHHPSAPILGNIDRLVIPAGKKVASHKSEIRTDRLLECKTASAFAAYKPEEWGAAGTDAVPMSYLVQCATYRILTGCQYADLAVLFGNQEVRIYNLASDAELEQMIIAKATEWWQTHIINDIAPEPQSDADVRLLYPQSAQGVACEADSSVIASLAELRTAKDEIKAWEAKADAAALAIKTSMGEAETLVWNGETLATWKSAKAGKKTDWKAMATVFHPTPELIAMYTAETQGSRRFLLKDEK